MAIAIPDGSWLRGGERRISLVKSPSTVINWVAVGLVPVVTVVALVVPWISPHDPLVPVGMPLQAPGKDGFLLGSDSVGRDILSRMLYGAQSSWFAALVVVAVGLILGGLVGLIAGATGGWIDSTLMRITDGFLSLPAPVLAARPHVEAAKLAGVGRIRLAMRHLLPGAVPNALVAASLDIGTLILTLAALSFLGLGQSAPAPELGADSARNLTYFLQQWWVPVMPGLAVLVLALIANIAGDGLRNLMKTS
jgi:peptide/nickel transport system permease protein